MISDVFLRLLRCPTTKRPLRVVDPSLLERVNAAIASRQLRNALGETVQQQLESALVNESMTLLYAVRDDIPCLLPEEAISLDQFEANGR